MGREHDARLLVGWRVNDGAAQDWLLEHKVSSCKDDEACYCGLKLCWKEQSPPLPRGWTLVEINLDNDETQVWLTLDLSDQLQDTWKKQAIPLDVLTRLQHESDLAAAAELAVKLESKDAIQVVSIVEVW